MAVEECPLAALWSSLDPRSSMCCCGRAGRKVFLVERCCRWLLSFFLCAAGIGALNDEHPWRVCGPVGIGPFSLTSHWARSAGDLCSKAWPAFVAWHVPILVKAYAERRLSDGLSIHLPGSLIAWYLGMADSWLGG